MKILDCKILSNVKVVSNTYRLRFSSVYLSEVSKPGQFINIKCGENNSAILRRPFSISNIEGDNLEVLYSVIGRGTEYLSKLDIDEKLNIVGPLGNGFDLSGDYHDAIIIGGGIGVAPFPFLIKKLKNDNKNLYPFFGFRNKDEIIDLSEINSKISTDDGSFGFKGNVIDLFKLYSNDFKNSNLKIFGCGPNNMLSALSDFSSVNALRTQISLESQMACGFGICQGCPVPSKNDPEKFYLICKDGPCFNTNQIILNKC